MMNRRNFLMTTFAGGLAIPLAASITKPKSSERFIITETFSPKFFSCVVGDFKVNLNGHIYKCEIWEKIFQFHVPLICVMEKDRIGWIEKIVGYVVAHHINDQISVIMRVLNTPGGNEFLKMYEAGARFFLTPTGKGLIKEDSYINEEYIFSYFSISNNSAFECATPLCQFVESYEEIK